MSKKRKVRPINVAFNILLVFLVIFLIYKVALFAFDFGKDSITEGSNTTQTATQGDGVTVTIAEGSSTKDIAVVLKENDLIGSELWFRIKSRLDGYDGNYKQGDFLLTKGMDNEEIMETLIKTPVYQGDKITIPEGYTLKQIAALVEKSGIATADEFIKEANEGVFNLDFVKDIPQRENRLEGYLFPDTYYISEDETANTLLTKMLTRFDGIYTNELRAEVEKTELTMDQIITIASIIEAEIVEPDEREVASGVIYNRLEIDKRLEMCSTVLYSLGIHKSDLTYDDLKVESPYNTYINNGLPIGPISNPGAASIYAAIYPQDNEYLYFVLKGDGQTSHVFTKTYEEFEEAKKVYKQSI